MAPNHASIHLWFTKSDEVSGQSHQNQAHPNVYFNVFPLHVVRVPLFIELFLTGKWTAGIDCGSRSAYHIHSSLAKVVCLLPRWLSNGHIICFCGACSIQHSISQRAVSQSDVNDLHAELAAACCCLFPFFFWPVHCNSKISHIRKGCPNAFGKKMAEYGPCHKIVDGGVDGYGEFEAKEDNPKFCEACECHRSFHKILPGGSSVTLQSGASVPGSSAGLVVNSLLSSMPSPRVTNPASHRCRAGWCVDPLGR
jgi:hypothetical protein